MPRLITAVDPSSAAFQRRRSATNLALASDLRETVARAALGGPAAARARRTQRGKRLARERLERLLDPGSPFLEMGQLAATVLATIRRDAIGGRGEAWGDQAEEAFKAPIRTRCEAEGDPYHATARLREDGVIDPAQRRDVLGLALYASLNALTPPTRFGVFRL
jgi:acetyl-CoA carboxylase carboxyltransferase component